VSERLQRLDQIFPRYPIYFVTTCTAKRRLLLANEVIHRAFESFASQGEVHGAFVGRYVLMPDHLHLFVALNDERISISQWTKALKGALSKSLRLAGHSAPHWQKGFFDHILRSSESYEEKWNYVHDNPVRAGLVADATAWPYAGEIHPLDVRDEAL